jgi:hypothetical protein
MQFTIGKIAFKACQLFYLSDNTYSLIFYASGA